MSLRIALIPNLLDHSIQLARTFATSEIDAPDTHFFIYTWGTIVNNFSLAEQQANQAPQGSNAGSPDAETLPMIYLESISIENFRGIENATFNFQPGLNVIIGANNTSKTALIDSLRIVLNLGTFEKKRDFIKVRSVDVFIDHNAISESKTVSFKSTFRMRSDRRPGQFYELLCDDEQIESGIKGIWRLIQKSLARHRSTSLTSVVLDRRSCWGRLLNKPHAMTSYSCPTALVLNTTRRNSVMST